MQINIAYCITPDFMEYASISAASVLRKCNRDDWYVFYIICEEFTPETQQYFLRLNKIKQSTYVFLKFPPHLLSQGNYKDRGESGLYRIFLSEILKNVDKVLYLDTDTIIHSDLAFLYKHDITDYYLAAVPDKEETIARKNTKLKKDQLFINSGVLLMNLAKFREEKLPQKIIKHLLKSRFKSDQNSINAICKDKILYLPIKYNVMMYPDGYPNPPLLYENFQEEYEDAKEYPVIHHMLFHPWTDEYEYLSTSKEWASVKDYINKF